MNEKFHRLGDFAINFDNIRYVQRKEVKDKSYLDIYFVGTDQPLMIDESKPEGKALLNWWQYKAKALPNGTEEIGIA